MVELTKLNNKQKEIIDQNDNYINLNENDICIDQKIDCINSANLQDERKQLNNELNTTESNNDITVDGVSKFFSLNSLSMLIMSFLGA